MNGQDPKLLGNMLWNIANQLCVAMNVDDLLLPLFLWKSIANVLHNFINCNMLNSVLCPVVPATPTNTAVVPTT